MSDFLRVLSKKFESILTYKFQIPNELATGKRSSIKWKVFIYVQLYIFESGIIYFYSSLLVQRLFGDSEGRRYCPILTTKT